VAQLALVLTVIPLTLSVPEVSQVEAVSIAYCDASLAQAGVVTATQHAVSSAVDCSTSCAHNGNANAMIAQHSGKNARDTSANSTAATPRQSATREGMKE
jgi:hypothetical protein